MREKWKKYVEKFKSLGDKVSGVKGITAVIPAVCLAVLMVTVLTGYKTPQAKKYEASETEDISQIKEALAKESTAAMAETTKKNTTKKGKKGAIDVKDGTYKGSANGYGGKVTVNVTVSKKTMTAIDIVSAPGETDSFFQRAKGVIDEMLTAQSTDVDVVSGATYSSNGIIGAVKNALFGTKRITVWNSRGCVYRLKDGAGVQRVAVLECIRSKIANGSAYCLIRNVCGKPCAVFYQHVPNLQ